ncbi:hypothetical protein C8F01DRAFT_1153929 [Mycena amicta]|nr:hypothetical protein C8F01DRAFT_1153929 [Mycena amicta]
MGSLCFSSASILRCESFTKLESQLLIIPTALELLFSSALIFTNWGYWRHLLLTAEGWSYFALALLELLSHNLPAVRDSVTVFSVVDIVLGATSFLPIFFYTLFLYLFTRGELIDTLPQRFQNIANILLLFFLPAIAVLNEVSSFVGISRRTLTLNGKDVVAIGFRTSNDQQLWTFLTSITLALLTAYQAINFCFAFYRLVRAFIDQRRIETTSTDQAHPIRGIGWISGAFKLGAIETVIGFAAQSGFGGALTRRIVRFLARACLVGGVVKGLDRMDDFTEITRELDASRPPIRRSRLGNLKISNPRFSTFQQLTPTATQFYEAPRAAPASKESPLHASMTQRQPVSLVRTMTQASQATQFTQDSSGHLRPRARERVTVHYDSGSAPTLSMRFSGLDMPSPAIIAESVKARPVSSSWVSIARSSRYAPSTGPSFAFDAPPVPMTYPEFIYDRGTIPMESQPATPEPRSKLHQRGVSEFSTRSSGYPDSLNAVRELAAKFPGTPGFKNLQEKSEWHDDPESQRNSRRSFDEIRTPPRTRTAPTTYQSPEHEAPMQYAYGGMDYPESPEPVYRYQYDGHLSSPEQHPYVYSPPVINPQTPPRHQYHRTTQSETTLGTAPPSGFAYLSPFDDSTSTVATEVSSNENPFLYDNDRRLSSKQQGVAQPVYMDDGPHSDGNPYQRTSAALLQMTQREVADWTPPEFTPSVVTPSVRNTLKKKRRAGKEGASVDTFASSWLQGDGDDPEAYADAEDDQRMMQSVARVKTVGRQRAPQKATPVPVNSKHGMTRGSVYIQPITVPPQEFHSEVQIVQGGSSADSYKSEFAENR